MAEREIEKNISNAKQSKDSKSKKSKSSSDSSNFGDTKKLFAVIRISGMVKVRKDIAETLDRLRLKRKYACVLIPDNRDLFGMLKKVRHHAAYGNIDKDVLEKLIKEGAENIEGRKMEVKY